MSNSVSCESVNAKLDAFHDQELSAQERAEVQAHIDACGSCAQYLAGVAAVKTGLQAMPVLTPKVDVAANFEQILASRTAKPANVSRLPIFWGGVGVAAAAVAIFAGRGLVSSNTVIGLRPAPQAVHSVPAHAVTEVANGIPLNQVPVAVQHNLAREEQAVSQTQTSGLRQTGVPQHKQVHANNAEPSLHKNEAEIASDNGVVAPISNSNEKAIDPMDSNQIATLPSNQNNPMAASIAAASDNSMAGGGSSINRSGRNLVAVYDADQPGSVTEELGIATDEDGLYAIKL